MRPQAVATAFVVRFAVSTALGFAGAANTSTAEGDKADMSQGAADRGKSVEMAALKRLMLT